MLRPGQDVEVLRVVVTVERDGDAGWDHPAHHAVVVVPRQELHGGPRTSKTSVPLPFETLPKMWLSCDACVTAVPPLGSVPICSRMLKVVEMGCVPMSLAV